ncbi:membrane protein [Flavobacterium aquatile]|uniref:Membrane protein n=1 Tax=Flavobacterium aquatile LMG 4008 = ATCC 11947 TaxID=1453498 RepID=A0A095V1H2_9FLAO|nr:membrane protein [Flavobacterium aquatile]KGD68685.1 membrane protein [Flavobacterium aquatile LMG 4008 = ATCC 11947]OXA66373.1 hypothetical protein B0A61_11705 [Flavobacterium aquatile LMG 4008 = ATCC 11947]GEC79503.1 hypothetical protein FAQ01_23730 [Flavobacterium aquatile]
MNENQNKDAVLVAYLTILGTVIAIFMNNEEKKTEFASFHIRQALGIFLSFFLLGYFVGYADSWTVSSAFYLFYFILWIYGFSGALSGQKRLIPVVGAFFQTTFKSL